MNKNFIIVCFLFAAVSVRAADSAVEAKVKTIRVHYSEIEGSLKNCKQVKRDLPGESAEGGELGFFNRGLRGWHGCGNFECAKRIPQNL